MRSSVTLALAVLLVGQAVAKRVTVVGNKLGTEPPPSDDPMDRSCGVLLTAYAAGIPVPLPIIPTGVQAVGLLTCCPHWIYEKVVALKETMGKSEAELWAMENANLTPEQLLEKTEDEQRDLLIDLYSTLVFEKKSRNAETKIGKLMASIRHWKGSKLSSKRFNIANYAENMETLKELELRMPWLLYHRLVGAFASPKLSKEEKWDFIKVMIALKEEYPFLPTVDALSQVRDERLPPVLLFSEELLNMADTADGSDQGPNKELANEEGEVEKAGNHTTIGERIKAKLGATRASACLSLGHACTRAVDKMKRYMNAPSKQQLAYLKQKVILFNAPKIEEPQATVDEAPAKVDEAPATVDEVVPLAEQELQMEDQDFKTAMAQIQAITKRVQEIAEAAQAAQAAQDAQDAQ